MNKDQVLRLALDFVEDVHLGEWSGPTERQEEVITAIKQALEQPEHHPKDDIATLPEPVAVVSGYYGGQCVILPINPSQIFNSNTALYTSPSKRKPLTDEEIDALPFPPSGTATLRDFVRIIEDAHGIKEKNT